MTLFTEDPPINIGAAKTLEDRFDPTFRQLMGASIGEGFDMTSGAAVARIIDFKTPGDSPLMTKEQYEGSKFFRKDIEYFDSMTESHAEILADRHDIREKRRFILSHAKGGLDFATVLTGGLLGSIPDPVNFIPVFGVGAKVAQVARLGRVAKRLKTINEARTLSIGGRVLRSSSEATIGAGATIPFIAKAEQLEQGDFDMRMVASMLAFSAVIGGGFGAISHGLRDVTIKDKIDAMSKALNDATEGKPIDVEPILGSRVNKASVRDLVKRHVNGEDVTQDAIVHPKFGKAEEFISQFRPEGVRGEDILRVIRSTDFTRNEFDNLIHEAIDDVSGLREVLRAFDAGEKGTKEQVGMLDAFKTNTETDFNSSTIAVNEKRLVEIKKSIEVDEKTIKDLELKKQNDIKNNNKKRAIQRQSEINDKIDSTNSKIDEQRRIASSNETLKARQEVLKSGRAEVDFATGKQEEIAPDVELRSDPEVTDLENVEVFNERLEQTTEEFNSRVEAGELPEGSKAIVDEQRKINAKSVEEAEAWKIAADCVING